MQKLEDFFNQSAEPPLNPRVREWGRRIDKGARAVLDLYWPTETIGLSAPEINLRFTENGQELPSETVQWTDELNAGLVELGVKAGNPEQESQRFALALRGALRKVAREFGDGYFNSVLLDLVKDSDLGSYYPTIQQVLKYTYGNPPEKTKAHQLCREMIANEIGAKAQELTKKLRYADEQAKAILAGAVSRYLDERFSVSVRRQMGLL